MRGTPGLCAALLMALPALLEPAAAGAVDAAVVTVEITNFAFAPALVTVPAGTTVRWINGDDTVHTVTAEDGSFASPPLDSDDSFSFRLDQPGEHAFYCKLHPHMTGRVRVLPSG